MTTENQAFTSGNQDVGAFVDRRNPEVDANTPVPERRQFSDGRTNLSPEAAELGKAIDQYKLINRRRYVSYEEMLSVIKSLGYTRS